MSKQQRPPAIQPRPWREPYDVLLAFVTATTAEEIERLRPGIASAMRDLKKRTWYLKMDEDPPSQPPSDWIENEDGTFSTLSGFPVNDCAWRDPEIGHALMKLLNATRANKLIDKATRLQIVKVLLKIGDYDDRHHLTSSE
jgi:hypothetical protein